MITNTPGSLRDVSKQAVSGDQPARGRDAASLSGMPEPKMGITDLSPQAQLVQHMVANWQSKEGAVSGKVLTTPEQAFAGSVDDPVVVDMLQAVDQQEQHSVSVPDYSAVPVVDSPSLTATRDAVAPDSSVATQSQRHDVIPVEVPELQGVIAEACFEFAAVPSLVEGRFEAFVV